ncbi:MurR/RpiR family transcriptional regulator [Stackebrandtia nassauensis]|uniref:Transcriptional regulator, RpiR family n=1 Tax=Stackebrandtia nassauensis (strain DSM 44728 / CIP 108903 / NRRL B-16338 / NBRC 102104 / LLR-40K-21) TaxID=446470 RepID=D3Q7G1_STANL|nr:MurR/RpiR family transcriptional regulator [Stackebrandtia nassauensis]ADD42432.1 transcriptional regulator, RpiR family [Stackebrandtia nassauensis DSM 44728]
MVPGGENEHLRDDSVIQRIRELAPGLAPAERRVAEAIVETPRLVMTKSITELAGVGRTSETTVVRFCRRAGFRGYPDLRLAIATELGGDLARSGGTLAPGTDIDRDDTLEQLVRKVAFADVRAIQETVERLDLEALERVIDVLSTARRISLFGLGASAFAAQDLQHKLLRIDRMALAIPDSHLALGSAALLKPDDVAVGLSHSGQTAEVVECLTVARQHGAKTIAIVNAAPSPLTEQADLVITTRVRESRFRSGAMASRLAQLAVVDCVFLGIAQRSYDAAVEALTTTHETVHRGGRP